MSASLTILATIRCVEVAAQRSCCGGAELHNLGWKSFVARAVADWGRQDSFWNSSGDVAVSSECSSHNRKYHCVVAAPLRNTVPGGFSFFFVPLNRSGRLCTKETMRAWQLCWSVRRIDRRLKDDNVSSLSFGQRSFKVLVANSSSRNSREQHHDSAVSTDVTDVEVVISVSGATGALVLFCKSIGVKPSFFLTEDFVGELEASVAIALITVHERHCPLLWPIRKASLRSVCTCLPPAIIEAWPATTMQTNRVKSLMSEVAARHGYFSDGQRLVGSLWRRRWICMGT